VNGDRKLVNQCALLRCHHDDNTNDDDIPDRQDLLDLRVLVGRRRHDQRAVEQIQRNAVRAHVVGAANASDATVRCHDQDWRKVSLERAVQERETLRVPAIAGGVSELTRKHASEAPHSLASQ